MTLELDPNPENKISQEQYSWYKLGYRMATQDFIFGRDYDDGLDRFEGNDPRNRDKKLLDDIEGISD